MKLRVRATFRSVYNLTNETHSTCTVRRAIFIFQLSRVFVVQKTDGTTLGEYSSVTRLSQFHLGFHLLSPCESVFTVKNVFRLQKKMNVPFPTSTVSKLEKILKYLLCPQEMNWTRKLLVKSMSFFRGLNYRISHITRSYLISILWVRKTVCLMEIILSLKVGWQQNSRIFIYFVFCCFFFVIKTLVLTFLIQLFVEI